MTFTLPMLIARLVDKRVGNSRGGAGHRHHRPRSMIVRLMPGLLLLLGVHPGAHHAVEQFPVWYHLTFLLSLVPLTYLGGTISRWQNNPTSHVLGDMRASF